MSTAVLPPGGLMAGTGGLRRKAGSTQFRRPAVAPKVLTETLRRLERDGILTRTAFPEIPPRVEYELTPLGRSLEQPIRSIAAWAEQNMTRITRARSAYDRRAA